MMKYQQLAYLETGWKWQYLISKYHDGISITRYIETSKAEVAVNSLIALEHATSDIDVWIAEHMNITLTNRLHQSIRARRKRYFDAEKEYTRKKSIDLEYKVWKELAQYAASHCFTLSKAIAHLLSQEAPDHSYEQKLRVMKGELATFLKEIGKYSPLSPEEVL